MAGKGTRGKGVLVTEAFDRGLGSEPVRRWDRIRSFRGGENGQGLKGGLFFFLGLLPIVARGDRRIRTSPYLPYTNQIRNR